MGDPTSPVSHRASILVVDDGLTERAALEAWLTELDFQTLLATDGSSALDLLDDPEVDVDLVLLDLHMPGMDGLDVLQHIRNRYSRTELPVIIVSGDPNHHLVIEAFHHGANDFIPKPLDPEELEARVEAHLAICAETRFRTTGGHRRLSRDPTGSLRHQPHSSTSHIFGMCPTCKTVTPLSESICRDCGLTVPRLGWSPIDRSSAPHLARVIGGRYLLEKPLGTGGTGVVYRARDLELDQRFAIKIITLPTDTPDALKRLQAEVGALTTVHNPHVVRIYEVLQLDDHTVALVTNYIDGVTLAELIRTHRRLPPRIALEITRQLAQGLHAVHAVGMIHRDVKPYNIMVEALPGGYFAHILDFGIAVALQEAIAPSSHFQGTPLYAAPEQSAGNHPVDVRADVYSLGVTLYEMLAGAPPFSSTSILSLFMQHQHRKIPALPFFVASPSVRHVLDALIHVALEKRPDERLASMADFIARIDDALHTLQSRVTIIGDEPSRPEPPSPAAVTAPTVVDARSAPIRQLFPPLPISLPSDAFIALNERFQAVALGHNPATGANVLTWLDFPRAESRSFDVIPGAIPTALSIDPGGTFAVLGTHSGHVIGVPLTPRLARRFDVRLSTRPVVALAFSRDGQWVAAADADGHIFMLSPNATSGVAIRHIDAPVRALGFSNDSNPIAVTSGHGVVALVGDMPVTTFELPDLSDVAHAAFDRDGISALLLTGRGLVVRIALVTGQLVEQFQFSDHALRALACTEDGVTAIAHIDDRLELWALDRIPPT